MFLGIYPMTAQCMKSGAKGNAIKFENQLYELHKVHKYASLPCSRVL